MIDPDSKIEFRKKLNALVAVQTDSTMRGVFPDLASFERQRGVIVGLGMAIDSLDEEKSQQEENKDDAEG